MPSTTREVPAYEPEIYDILIIGAGISGINSAYRIQTSLPRYTYTILEARSSLGGTWDFFKYPGIRSDSDLHTFGFQWRPWNEPRAMADAASICNYLKESAEAYGINKHMQFRHKVLEVDWESKAYRWRINCTCDGLMKEVFARWLVFGTGYYDYDTPFQTVIPGIENFKGAVVHPQFWPEDLNYTGKKVVVIGSGATAVTLLPALAEKAEHVTQLQRSPSYVMSLPNPTQGTLLQRLLPEAWYLKLLRIQFLIEPFLFWLFCTTFPGAARKILQWETTKALPPHIPHDPHFRPSYNPWEQRLCLCPDNDYFKTLRGGKASIVTDHIKTFMSDSIVLQSGEILPADIVVTATGLKILIGGGATISIDGQKVDMAQKFLWRYTMLQDVPNAAFIEGYTTATWTLGADATAQLLCRVIKNAEEKGASSVVPRLENPQAMKALPALDLSSTYVKEALHYLPKTGPTGPWRMRSNYFVDIWNAWFGNITDGLEYVNPNNKVKSLHSKME